MLPFNWWWVRLFWTPFGLVSDTLPYIWTQFFGIQWIVKSKNGSCSLWTPDKVTHAMTSCICNFVEEKRQAKGLVHVLSDRVISILVCIFSFNVLILVVFYKNRIFY